MLTNDQKELCKKIVNELKTETSNDSELMELLASEKCKCYDIEYSPEIGKFIHELIMFNK